MAGNRPARGRRSKPEPLRHAGHLLALAPLLAGLAFLPLFLDGRIDGSLAAPTYVLAVSATVLVGSIASEGAHPVVSLAGLLGLAGAAGWLWAAGPPPSLPLGDVLDAWTLSPASTGLPAWWPLILAVPAALVVVVETVRGEAPLPHDAGERGVLEGLPGRPALFGLAGLVVGVAGTLFAGSTFLEKVAVVAPIFEELAKLGVALLVLDALGLSRPGPAFGLGILSGLSFGLLEHAVTYSGEPRVMFVVRVLFHALSAGLSMLVYVHLVRREGVEPGVAWFAIGPSALVHAANNVSAVGLALVELAVPLPTLLSPAIGGLFVLALLLLAGKTIVQPRTVAGAVARAWHRLNGEVERVSFRPLARR